VIVIFCSRARKGTTGGKSKFDRDICPSTWERKSRIRLVWIGILVENGLLAAAVSGSRVHDVVIIAA